jgi:hypothetical protein
VGGNYRSAEAMPLSLPTNTFTEVGGNYWSAEADPAIGAAAASRRVIHHHGSA